MFIMRSPKRRGLRFFETTTSCIQSDVRMKVCKLYQEGQGDLVSRLLALITHIVTLVILIIDLPAKSP